MNCDRRTVFTHLGHEVRYADFILPVRVEPAFDGT